LGKIRNNLKLMGYFGNLLPCPFGKFEKTHMTNSRDSSKNLMLIGYGVT